MNEGKVKQQKILERKQQEEAKRQKGAMQSWKKQIVEIKTNMDKTPQELEEERKQKYQNKMKSMR